MEFRTIDWRQELARRGQISKFKILKYLRVGASRFSSFRGSSIVFRDDKKSSVDLKVFG